MIFPFHCLLETVDESARWGPDCASPISAAQTNLHDRSKTQQLMSMLMFASLFGAMHFMTWSFSMPTMVELWMWRFASIALTSLPILVALLAHAWPSLESFSNSLTAMAKFVSLVFLVLHPLIRLVIAVDSVVLLRTLPDSAFLVLSWSDSMPSL